MQELVDEVRVFNTDLKEKFATQQYRASLCMLFWNVYRKILHFTPTYTDYAHSHNDALSKTPNP